MAVPPLAAKEQRRPKWEWQYFSPNAISKIICYELVGIGRRNQGFPGFTQFGERGIKVAG